MQLLFEEGGEIRAGTVLSQQGEAYQVELPSAKRTKVKSRDVLLQFAQPSAGELSKAAHALTSSALPTWPASTSARAQMPRSRPRLRLHCTVRPSTSAAKAVAATSARPKTS